MPQPAVPTTVQAALGLAEECASTMSQALLLGEPAAIESAARDLQQASLCLSGLLQGRPGKPAKAPDLRQRLASVARVMAMQREALLRRSAVVERSLHFIVPASRSTTYGASGPYGHNARQTGAFKLLAA